MNQVKISVITPVLNGEATIEKCLHSVAVQTYPYKEHWIIDGISSDKTLEIVKKYTDKYPHIRYISQKDTGIYQAMNRGIDLSSGEWLYFLGCDDVLANPDILAKVSYNFQPNIDWLLGQIVLTGFSKLILRTPSTSWERYLFSSILHQGCFYKRKLFDTLQYDESFVIAGDYKLNLQLLEWKVPYKTMNLVVCNHSIEGISGQSIYITLKENIRLRYEVLPFHLALFWNTLIYLGFYAMQTLKALTPPRYRQKIQVLKQRYIMK
jgi:putative colanic acid biosynthesis glycosyltransferase